MVWYYVRDGARQGPVEEDEFRTLVSREIVRPETLVWRDGMADWGPYSTVMPAKAAESQPAPRAEPFETATAAVAPATSYGYYQYCSQCGHQYPPEELARFGAATVCANCKDIYTQRLRETGQVVGARIYGGFWIRFLAVLIDGVALWIVNFVLETSIGTRVTNPGNFAGAMSHLGVNMILSTSISLLYECFFLVQYGATPGKMVFKLKVITPDGGPISWGRAIGRYFAKWLSAITLLIGYIMAGFDPEKRALHDYVAGTRVIRTA
jgi:uncharacterized RDD family membrane protein YckC